MEDMSFTINNNYSIKGVHVIEADQGAFGERTVQRPHGMSMEGYPGLIMAAPSMYATVFNKLQQYYTYQSEA